MVGPVYQDQTPHSYSDNFAPITGEKERIEKQKALVSKFFAKEKEMKTSQVGVTVLQMATVQKILNQGKGGWLAINPPSLKIRSQNRLLQIGPYFTGCAAGSEDGQEGELGEEQGGDRGGGDCHGGSGHLPGRQFSRIAHQKEITLIHKPRLQKGKKNNTNFASPSNNFTRLDALQTLASCKQLPKSIELQPRAPRCPSTRWSRG